MTATDESSRAAREPRVARNPRVRLIVCGEPERGDDAAGRIAVAALPPDVLTFVEVVEAPALDVDTLIDVPTGTSCVLVDAAVGIQPGEIVTVPLDHLLDGRRQVSPRSSHELPVNQVIGLASVLRDGLPDGLFVGVGAASAEFGAPLSLPVEASMRRFGEAIADAVLQLASVANGPARPERRRAPRRGHARAL